MWESKTFRAVSLPGLLALCVAAAADAQPAEPPGGGWTIVRARIDAAVVADSDFEDARGSLSLRTVVGEVGSMLPLARSTLLGPRIAYRNTRVDFDDFVLGGRRTSPFDTIHESSVGAQLIQRFGERWSLLAIGGVTNAIADGADVEDGWKPRLFAVVNYRVSDTLTVGLGLGGTYDLDDEVRGFPVLSLDWRPHPRWRVEVRNDVTIAALVHEPTRLEVGLTASFSGRFGDRTFRLSDRGPLPGGIGEIEALAAGVDLRIAPSDRVDLRLLVGAVTSYSLTLRARDETRVFDERIDAAPFVAVEAVVRF